MINVLDIETFEEDGNVIPYCICLSLENKEISFYLDTDENIIGRALYYIFHNSLSNHTEIFVHNLNFDGVLIIEFLSQSKSLFEIKSINTNLYWIKIFYLEKIITVRCSYKIIPLSLKKIGEIERFEKLTFPYKFIKRENINYIGDVPNIENWEKGEYRQVREKGVYDVKKETIKYCLNDIRIVKRCLSNLFKIIGEIDIKLISVCFSAPSMSHKIFFKYFNYRKISKKVDKKIDVYTRRSYKGGRCEVFGNPKNDEIIKYYDFPGMYGMCMKEKFHNGKYKITTKAEICETGFHTITYKSNNPIPILPSHSEKGKLLFANGVNTDTVWFEELLYFIENGGIILKKHHSLVFDKYEEVFTDFVNFFEKIRLKEGYYKIFGKLMINSLYGSMALKDENYYNYITFSQTEFEYISKNLNIYKFYKLNNIYIIIINKDYKFKDIFGNKLTELEKTTRNVTYSAAIASKARIKLHKFLMEVEKDGGRPLYSDTDSVFAAYPASDQRKKIGDTEWIKFYDDGVFSCPKSYALKDKNNEIIKIKGISIKDIGFNDFKKMFYDEKDYDFKYQKINAKKNFILHQKEISKNINFEKYDKRVFDKDKKKTSPIIIDYSPSNTTQTYSE